MSAKPALLIVDDDPLIGEGLSFVLSSDFSVRVCQSRVEAMTLLRDGHAGLNDMVEKESIDYRVWPDQPGFGAKRRSGAGGMNLSEPPSSSNA